MRSASIVEERSGSAPDRAGDLDPTAGTLAAAVEAVRAGRTEAWSELWGLLEPTVTGVARGRFRLDPTDVEDIGQEVWLRLQLHLDRIAEPRAVRGWVRTTATRECLRLLRQRRAETVPDDVLADEADAADGPERVVEHRDVCRAVDQAVGRLSARRRTLVRLLFHEDRDYADIAEQLSMPIGSIGPTRCRLMDRLRTDPELASLA